jgi:hypothetical protein
MHMWMISAPRRHVCRAWVSVNGASVMVMVIEVLDSRAGKALRSLDLERMKMLRVRSFGGLAR